MAPKSPKKGAVKKTKAESSSKKEKKEKDPNAPKVSYQRPP